MSISPTTGQMAAEGEQRQNSAVDVPRLELGGLKLGSSIESIMKDRAADLKFKWMSVDPSTKLPYRLADSDGAWCSLNCSDLSHFVLGGQIPDRATCSFVKADGQYKLRSVIVTFDGFRREKKDEILEALIKKFGQPVSTESIISSPKGDRTELAVWKNSVNSMNLVHWTRSAASLRERPMDFAKDGLTLTVTNAALDAIFWRRN